MPSPPSLQPTCETDSSSDEGLARSKSRSRSNVSAKRTSQSELDRTHHAAWTTDLTSDSGYSSRTAATGSSADSAKSPNHRRRSPVKPEAPPAVPDAPAAAPPAQTRSRQPETLKKKTATARESPKSSKTSTKHKDKKPVVVQKSSIKGRTASVSRSRRDSLRQDCNDPDCHECLGRPKPKLPPLKTGMNDDYSTHTPRSPRVPPSPSRPPFGYHHPAIKTQIAGSTRPMYARERPHSYYEGSSLSERYNYPQSATSHGPPPPSMYNHPQYATMMAPSPHPSYYGSLPPPSPRSASYDNRPPLPSRTSDGYMPRPPAPGLPNPRYGPGLIAASYPQAPVNDDSDDDDEDEHGYYLHSSAERDRMIMPPPPQPAVETSRRRPSLRSQTTSNIPHVRAASVGYRGRPEDHEQDLVGMTQSLQLPSRRSSVAGSDRTLYQRNNVLIQPSRSDRPRDSERERTRRNTLYNRDVAHLEFDPTLRRDASADDRRKEKMHNDSAKVEAYLAGMNGNYSTVVDGLRTNPARGRASSNALPMRTTSHSQHSFDGASRISEARSTSTRKTARDGNVAIRFEGSDMFVEGDMGDKVLRVTTGEDGNQQITIADTKGRERKYHGEGSRVTTNTSSSRSRSDNDSARPRADSRSTHDSRSAHDRDIELKRRGLKQRSVRYADEPHREYSRTERSYRPFR